jgi:heptosyltransferase II
VNTSAGNRRRALIVKFGQIGDVIMTIPGVRALYDQGFDIDWACGRAVYPLLQTYSWIRSFGVDDRNIFRGSLFAKTRAVLDFWRQTCRTRYDLIAILYYDFRFRLLALPLRATSKIRLSHSKRARMLLPGRHHADEFLRILLVQTDGFREQSAAPIMPDLRVSCPLPSKNAARRIVLVPGGTSNVLGEQSLRRWPIENYVAVAKTLLARGWEVILLGGPEDLWTKPYFDSLATVDCVGKLTLPEALSVCEASEAVLCHDTGPLHLAGLSNTCLVGIFGPTDPGTRIPRRPNAVGIWGGQGFACRPCYDGAKFARCQFNGCMHTITPEIAIRQLESLLAARVQNAAEGWKIVSI